MKRYRVKQVDTLMKKAPPKQPDMDLSVFTVEELEQLQALMTAYHERIKAKNPIGIRFE